MNDDKVLGRILKAVQPIELPPAEYPPAAIVRDTPRDDLKQRIRANAEKVGIELTDEHWEVIDFLFDFYVNCCDSDTDPGYVKQETYWKYVDCLYDEACMKEKESHLKRECPYGELSPKECTSGYRVYRILESRFKDKGGATHLYRLFPYGPIFTIHLLAQLPRLRHDANPHFGTSF